MTRRRTLISAAAPDSQTMTDIPDISDSPPLAPKPDNPSEAMGKLNIDDKGDTINEEEIPDMDDIPDMDEAAGLEEEGDDAAVRIVHPSESVLSSHTLRHWKLMR
jgi:ubiquitin-like-conjugating enzyme ATG3